jgi:hypothetical protein
LRLRSLGFCVIAAVIALAFIGKIHALPRSFTQEAGVCDREAELSPVTCPENVNVVSPAEDNNVVLPRSELFALVGSGRIWDSIPVHFLHLGVTDTDFWKEYPCFYSVMRAIVATAHPIDLCGGGIVQYLHTGINVNAFGGSLAGVGNTDVGTHRLAWVNNDRRARIFRLTNKIDSEPSPFVGLRSVKLSLVHSPSKNSDNDQEQIYHYLSDFIWSNGTEIAGYLWLGLGAVLLFFAQIIPLRHHRLGKNLGAGLAIGFGLFILGLFCINQFYDLVFLK